MFGREFGSKTGAGNLMNSSMVNISRRERLRQLAMERITRGLDPYLVKNHLGSYECKLCLTLHPNEASYLAHTQGKRHQMNLAHRAQKEDSSNESTGMYEYAPGPIPQSSLLPSRPSALPKVKKSVKIGRPGYRVTKQRNPETRQRSLLFEIEYPEIEQGLQPRHRFMSAFEQKVEKPDRNYQYLLFAAEPYETIAFKIPNKEIERDTNDKTKGRFYTKWDDDKKVFTLQVHFKN